MATNGQDERRPLPFEGQFVHWVARGADTSVRLDISCSEFQEIRIACSFQVRRPDGTIACGDPERPEDLVSLLVLAGRTIADASFAEDLVVRFDDGTELTVPPDPNFEAWEARGAGGLLVVATPGGGEPAIWSSRPHS